jgi:hypothetical protein
VPWRRERAHDVLYGAIAGVNGAACMSILRVAARRAGLLEAMPPQVLRESLSGQRDEAVTPQLADHGIHLAIGLAGGGSYGALFGRRAGVGPALLWGAALWAASLLMFIPVLGWRRARRQTRIPQAAVNLAAHLVYGGVLALLLRDLPAQDTERRWRADRGARRVG